MKLVLLGPPGSGKGTQAGRLVELTGAAHISTGDLLRAEVEADTELGRRVDRYQLAGELVPDAIIVELTLPLVVAAAADRGYVLDGFPRSLSQARSLDDGVPDVARADRALLLTVPEVELFARMQARSALEHRADDTPEVFEHRLSVYASETRPLAAYYRQQGVLLEVDAAAEPDQVSSRIRAALRL